MCFFFIISTHNIYQIQPTSLPTTLCFSFSLFFCLSPFFPLSLPQSLPIFQQNQFVLPKYFWMCDFCTGVVNLPQATLLQKNCLSVSQLLKTHNSLTARGGTSCPTPIPTLRCGLVWACTDFVCIVCFYTLSALLPQWSLSLGVRVSFICIYYIYVPFRTEHSHS